jgi:hypothetical protein
MMRSPRNRRALSLTLMVLGGLLIFLAPVNVWVGVIFVAIGIAVEVAGLILGHRNQGR